MLLFLHVLLSKPKYGHFLILSHGHAFSWNGHISEKRQQNEKTRALSFLQLLKFEKAKWHYFCILCFLSRDMAIFLFCPMDMLFIKWLYLRKDAAKKNKGTFFSSTFKVWESKVTLFLHFMLLSQNMAIFWFCPMDMLFHEMAISRKRGSKTKKQGHFPFFNF